jgi:hypothetical protein
MWAQVGPKDWPGAETLSGVQESLLEQGANPASAGEGLKW